MAKLPTQENQFYYDKELKRWVQKVQRRRNQLRGSHPSHKRTVCVCVPVRTPQGVKPEEIVKPPPPPMALGGGGGPAPGGGGGAPPGGMGGGAGGAPPGAGGNPSSMPSAGTGPTMGGISLAPPAPPSYVSVCGVRSLHYSLTWCWLLCRYRALGKRRGMRSRYVDPLNKGGAPQAPMTAPPGARTRRSAAPPKFTVFKPT